MKQFNGRKRKMVWMTVCTAICLAACGSSKDKVQQQKEAQAKEISTENPDGSGMPISTLSAAAQLPDASAAVILQPEPPQGTVIRTSHAHREPVDKTAQYAAYKKILLNMVQNYELLFEESGPVTEQLKEQAAADCNEFAVADVDGDGSEELLVNAIGKIGNIYDYDSETGSCYLQYSGWPSQTFYENGVLEEGWSHNQGKAGRFWPYSLYAYDRETDSFQNVGSVDAYDRDLYEANKETLAENPFPYEVDADGNGFVYYLYDKDMTDYGTKEAVDDKAYREWLHSHTGGSEKIKITYHDAVPEKIESFF